MRHLTGASETRRVPSQLAVTASPAACAQTDLLNVARWPPWLGCKMFNFSARSLRWPASGARTRPSQLGRCARGERRRLEGPQEPNRSAVPLPPERRMHSARLAPCTEYIAGTVLYVTLCHSTAGRPRIMPAGAAAAAAASAHLACCDQCQRIGALSPKRTLTLRQRSSEEEAERTRLLLAAMAAAFLHLRQPARSDGHPFGHQGVTCGGRAASEPRLQRQCKRLRQGSTWNYPGFSQGSARV